MENKLMIVARIQAKKGEGDFLLSELSKLLEPTKKEDGCYKYDLHRDNNDPDFFVFYEIWESKKHLDDHMKTPHIVAYMAAVDGNIDDFVVHEMTFIG